LRTRFDRKLMDGGVQAVRSNVAVARSRERDGAEHASIAFGDKTLAGGDSLAGDCGALVYRGVVQAHRRQVRVSPTQQRDAAARSALRDHHPAPAAG
jgi:regulator of RNase E activity RraA